MTIYYINGICGGTQIDRDNFYSKLKEIKDKSLDKTTAWNGDYLVTTFTLPNNTHAIYTENMEYGIPTKIEMED